MSASMGSSIIQSRSWHEDSGSNEPEQWPAIFNTQPRESHDASFDATVWWFQPKSAASYRGQAEFPRILSENGKNDLEDQGQ